MRRGWRRDEGRSVAWWGKEHDRRRRGRNRDGDRVTDGGGATGIGIKSRMVERGHWRGIGRGWPDAISSLAGDLMQAQGCVRCEAVAGVRTRAWAERLGARPSHL